MTVISIADNQTVQQGGVVRVAINIDDATGLTAFTVDISYNTALLDTTFIASPDNVPGETVPLVAVGSLTNGFTLRSNGSEANGTIRVVGFNSGPLASGAGSLFELEFTGVAPGTSVLDLVSVQINENPTSPTLDDGSLIVNAGGGATVTFDIDGNGAADALTDGVLILRDLFGFQGDTLIDGAVGASAALTTADAIANAIDQAASILDVDGNGAQDALTDGVLILRALFGFQGDTLIDGAVGAGATRTTADAISAFISLALPVTPGGLELLSTGVGLEAVADLGLDSAQVLSSDQGTVTPPSAFSAQADSALPSLESSYGMSNVQLVSTSPSISLSDAIIFVPENSNLS
jgi:hypothetical protein